MEHNKKNISNNNDGGKEIRMNHFFAFYPPHKSGKENNGNNSNKGNEKGKGGNEK